MYRTLTLDASIVRDSAGQVVYLLVNFDFVNTLPKDLSWSSIRTSFEQV